MSKKKKRRTTKLKTTGPGAPPRMNASQDIGSPYRWQHSQGFDMVRNPGGDSGKSMTAAKTRDGLDKMFKNRTITKAEYLAARRFQHDFDLAGLHGISAIDLEKVASGSGFISCGMPVEIEQARRNVWNTMADLGGTQNAMARALWYFVGLGHSLQVIADELAPKPDADPNARKARGFWHHVLLMAISRIAAPPLERM